MELRHLRYFVAVAEELNFTRAAERLHMAQPPLSAQIRALEDELGAELFVREKRRVYLSDAGKELLDRARSILEASVQAKVAARSAAEGVIGRASLGYTASAMFTERLPAAIRGFAAAHPTIAMSLHEMTSLDQLRAIDARELDVGILRKPEVEPPSGVTVEPWYLAPLVAAVPSGHALAEHKGIRMKHLADEPLLSYPRDSGIGLYWVVLQLCTAAGFRPQIVREAREPSVMIGLVAAGVGIAIVPEDTRSIQLRGVTYQRILDPQAVSTLFLAHRSGKESDHVQSLVHALRQAGDRVRSKRGH